MAEHFVPASKNYGLPPEAVSVFGIPDGPEKNVPGLGWVGTFLFAHKDKRSHKLRNVDTLMHHVPADKRGKYQISEGNIGPLGERLDPNRYALCNGIAGLSSPKAESIRQCNAVAVNRSGYCSVHGGALHPLDRAKIDWDKVPRHIKFAHGKLSYDEMTDEELAKGQVRMPNGGWSDIRQVSTEVHQAMTARLFERADEVLRSRIVEASEIVAEIMSSSAIEPADRLNAVKFLFERVRGKTPTKVEVTQEKPFEVVLGAVLQGGSRAESRAARGVGGPGSELEGIVDAEYTEEPVSEALYDEGLEDDGRYNAQTHPLAASPPQPAEREPYVPPVSSPPGIVTGPPENPVLRDQHEKAKAAEEAAAFKERIQAARARRYASRANGHANVESVPFNMEVEDSPEDGPSATTVFLIPPPEPKLSKAQHLKEQRRSRKKTYD